MKGRPRCAFRRRNLHIFVAKACMPPLSKPVHFSTQIYILFGAKMHIFLRKICIFFWKNSAQFAGPICIPPSQKIVHFSGKNLHKLTQQTHILHARKFMHFFVRFCIKFCAFWHIFLRILAYILVHFCSNFRAILHLF